MSKQKNKIKADKTDIVCRAVMAVMAAAIPVVSYFMNMIYYVVESAMFGLIAQFQGDTTDDGSTYGYLGFHYFFTVIFPHIKGNGENKETLSNLWTTLEPVHTALICFVAFFAIAIVVALVIFFVSIFSNSKKVPLCLACVGLIAAIGMFISFRQFSAPLVDDTIPLSSFFESALVSLILPFVAKISVLNLSSAWVMILVIYISMIIWTGAQLVISIGETPKAKKKASK